jgi:putative transposase
VTTRGVFGRRVFVDDADRLFFLALLALVIRRYRWDCHAFCLMGTHYHLVVETTIEQLSAGMQYLNGVYAQRFNARHQRDGHVFGDRFACWVIHDDEHYERTVEYVLTNPVRAGLVDDWTDWRWSGVRGVRSTAPIETRAASAGVCQAGGSPSTAGSAPLPPVAGRKSASAETPRAARTRFTRSLLRSCKRRKRAPPTPVRKTLSEHTFGG